MMSAVAGAGVVTLVARTATSNWVVTVRSAILLSEVAVRGHCGGCKIKGFRAGAT